MWCGAATFHAADPSPGHDELHARFCPSAILRNHGDDDQQRAYKLPDEHVLGDLSDDGSTAFDSDH